METRSRQDILNECEETLGVVPEWVENQPEEALNGFWTLFRDFYLGQTKIPNKYKELIGIGVSGATRCRYCALFHTEAAKLYGATEEEINEAAMMGAVTMLGSTYLNGSQADYEIFAGEVVDMVDYLQRHANGHAAAGESSSGEADIEPPPEAEPPQPHA